MEIAAAEKFLYSHIPMRLPRPVGFLETRTVTTLESFKMLDDKLVKRTCFWISRPVYPLGGCRLYEFRPQPKNLFRREAAKRVLGFAAQRFSAYPPGFLLIPSRSRAPGLFFFFPLLFVELKTHVSPGMGPVEEKTLSGPYDATRKQGRLSLFREIPILLPPGVSRKRRTRAGEER